MHLQRTGGRLPGGEATIRTRLATAPGLTRAEGHWFAGLVEAEGHFSLRRNNGGENWCCAFALALRDDDSDVLADLQAQTGLGHLNHKPARGGSRPQVVWRIGSRTECLTLADLLEAYPLRGR